MPRSVALAILVFGIAGLARADIAPPKGIKRIPVEGKLIAERAFADYVFFAVSGGDKATPLTIDPKNPATIRAAGGRYRVANLVAVPKEAARKFDSEKDFHAAVAKGKVDGLVKSKVNFFATTDVKDSDTRKTAVQEYKLVKVDAKEIVLEAVKAEKDSPKNAPDDEPEQMSATPRNGILVSGIAGFLGLALAGVWIARRFR